MMSDDRSQPAADATDVAVEQIIPPEQPPMDDAAGGPAAPRESDRPEPAASGDGESDAEDIDAVSTDDLTVQGGD